ncbi:hypothetical protein CRUP_016065 [Coryphaenoides rupestris]|nr:hypothetical protein CRUP_016065 [Coryphaenoides rupestris]
MGHRASKSSEVELPEVPEVRFTRHEVTTPPPPSSPPRHNKNSRLTAHGQSASNLRIPGSGTGGGGGDADNCRQEMRRSSIYSTIDMVPQLDFYANSVSAEHCRPTLKTLRRPTVFAC